MALLLVTRVSPLPAILACSFLNDSTRIILTFVPPLYPLQIISPSHHHSCSVPSRHKYPAHIHLRVFLVIYSNAREVLHALFKYTYFGIAFLYHLILSVADFTFSMTKKEAQVIRTMDLISFTYQLPIKYISRTGMKSNDELNTISRISW